MLYMVIHVHIILHTRIPGKARATLLLIWAVGTHFEAADLDYGTRLLSVDFPVNHAGSPQELPGGSSRVNAIGG
jgi:hypothetical protein